jgi:hypothetical protein
MRSNVVDSVHEDRAVAEGGFPVGGAAPRDDIRAAGRVGDVLRSYRATP